VLEPVLLEKNKAEDKLKVKQQQQWVWGGGQQQQQAVMQEEEQIELFMRITTHTDSLARGGREAE